MITSKLLMTSNWKEIEDATNLGIKAPKPERSHAEMLFWKRDIKKCIIDNNIIMIEFYNENTYEIEYDEKLWRELKKYFIDNEE